MNESVFRPDEACQVYPIGLVRHTEAGVQLVIREPFRAGLKQLDQFSHVIVFWWANRHDNEPDRLTLETDLPYAPGERAGVFACRSPYRPNPIAITICPMFGMDEAQGTILVPWIDAEDGTPLVDLKPYVPMSERVREVQVARWFEGWPQWMEDAADFDFEAAGLSG
jgi:tRNA-Thr(GGU) m(6)t(6)A37 methyltransferase TsaA